MKFQDKEIVDGTRVTIGRRINHRSVDGQVVERISATYTAEYVDVDGRRRFERLGTTNKREARRRAIEIQSRLESGKSREKPSRITIEDLIARFREYNENKGLAPKSLAKYHAELVKIDQFCRESGIRLAGRFDEEAFYKFSAWLRAQKHKQGAGYASKTVYTCLTICKQLFKFGWRNGLLANYALAAANLPIGRARPQPCFTSEQVDQLIAHTDGQLRDAITILAFTGLRVGELEQLRWENVLLDRGELGMLHICRGGSGDATKDKDDRFVPIHPRVRPLLDALPRVDAHVLPGLRARSLLTQLKCACRELGFGGNYKTHSFRHFFASMCANSRLPYRMALAWMGHSSSAILDLYYHLHDAESEAAMMTLAEGAIRQRT